MKIDNKMISLPPFLSTSWSNIRAIYLKGSLLVVNLTDGDTIQIPNLPEDVIERIFLCHAAFLEHEPIKQQIQQHLPFPMEMGGELPVRFAFGTPDHNMLGAMQHNPAQANIPNLPIEILSKIAAIAKIMVPNQDVNLIPKGEPHCNCPFCQVSRAIHDELDPHDTIIARIEDDEVTDEDLEFQQWVVQSTGEKLYVVTNKLDMAEKYTVYLGEPVGCTCGKSGCDHVVAVLKT